MPYAHYTSFVVIAQIFYSKSINEPQVLVIMLGTIKCSCTKQKFQRIKIDFNRTKSRDTGWKGKQK